MGGGVRLPKSFYERPLTPKEAQFATDNINIVWWYLDQQGLDRAEWFDVVIFRYLISVKRWFALPDLQKVKFVTVACNAMRSAIGNARRKSAKEPQTVSLYTLLVKVGVAAKKNFQDVQTLLKRVAPVNLVLVVQQLFNIHQVLGGFTHAQLAWYTHSEVRTEELQTHECTPHKTLRPFTHAQLGGLENKSIRKEMTDGTVHT